MALWRKGCPRCKGDVFEQEDLDGRSLTCLQCGRSLTAGQESTLREERLRQAQPAAQRSSVAA